MKSIKDTHSKIIQQSKQAQTITDTSPYKTLPDGTIEGKFLIQLHRLFLSTANMELSKFRDREGNHARFEIDDENKHFYGTLMRYFARHKEFYDSKLIKNEPSLDKGLLICGSTGLGKTLMFTMFSKMPEILKYSNNNFAFHDANSVVSEYDQHGETGIKDMYRGQRCFDDLGTEEKGQHYKSSEVFKKLIESRYRLFIETMAKTHITTNLSKDEIFTRYGQRADSRFYELFNILVIEGKDRRKI